MVIRTNTSKRESGFTILEGAIVVLAIGILLAMSTPKILNAVREHRLSIAARETADLIQRAKAQAVSDNRTSSLMMDTAGRRMGMAIYDSGGTIVDAVYVPLPQGIDFQTPPSVTAPVTGAPTSAAVSFPAYGSSTTVFKQDFTTRGFPSVAPGTINAIYLTNGRSYRALTMNSVGGIRMWWWENGAWVGAR